MEPSEQERLQELARFLKTRRARISPEQAGLPNTGRRRTPGLRRSEVAQLAWISVDWYTRLEQGRDIQVSAQVLDNIAEALKLNATERRHLYMLALQQLPPDFTQSVRSVSPYLQRFLDQQGTSPALVTDQQLNIVAWNQASNLIYGDYEMLSVRDRNSLWRTFTSPVIRRLLQEKWEAHARHRLAQFRANYGKFTGDPQWIALIEELSGISEPFRSWWQEHDVIVGPEGKKINYHPIAGRLEFDQLAFQVSDAPHLTVTINMPADEETTTRVRTLLERG
ncbi:helix-turn-helix domain-containing protein [Paenibacillus lycopersici]|uniref:Helix-turn-helix domain-containing protein n=2 Tax=Paenibacillus lycopersici TaxID=2704462 RepID=A0A6C0G866_9BACL|nr:helix-turn-helix transcriptional regulator [Paenibacillus lycopersici]QHT63940.1 helix-turn-helix domain-containing protein [Paenibacillus lycopersici]